MGSTLSLSHSKLVARHRRKTTAAANVHYYELNGNDVTDRLMTSSQQSSVKVGRAKTTSRLLAVFTGRKSASVATFSTNGDVISGNGARRWHQPNNQSERDEDMSRLTNHGADKFDLEQKESKVTGKHEGRRPKLKGPAAAVGPFRHWSVHNMFSRTSSVGPMVDRVVSVVAYRHNAADSDNVNANVNVNVKDNIIKQAQQNKTSDGRHRQSVVQLRCDSELREVRCSRLLCCLDEFVRRRCGHRRHTSSLTVSTCLQSVDRDLLTSGWQVSSLIDDTTTIFVYALLSHCIDAYSNEETCDDDLRTLVHVCLYLSYTYIGCEISYPLRPFLRGCFTVQRPTVATENDDNSDDDDDDDDEDIIINHACATQTRHSLCSNDSDDVPDDHRRRFWTCCMSLVHHCSWLMLRLNSDSELYARVYRQLTFYSCPPSHCTAVHSSVCREP